jgi:hypothetical protein
MAQHPKIDSDMSWLEGRLSLAPDAMGDRVPGLKLPLPVFKTRLKDSCCNLSAQGGWRVYYAVSVQTVRVYMVFFHHKKEIENPGMVFLQQKIQKAFEVGE